MKTKYLGVTAVVIAITSALVAALVFMLVVFQPSPSLNARPPQPRALTPAETNQRQAIERYTAEMDQFFKQAAAHQVDYGRLFPEPPVIIPPPVVVVRERALNMVYRSANDAYALIDDRLYRIGDALPDNATLLSIDVDSVVLLDNGQRRRLSLNRNTLNPAAAPRGMQSYVVE
jgi:hypothetical protein